MTRPAAFPDPDAMPMGVRQPIEIAPGVTLLGWDAPPQSIRPGETLPLTLYWQARGEEHDCVYAASAADSDQGEHDVVDGAAD